MRRIASSAALILMWTGTLCVTGAGALAQDAVPELSPETAVTVGDLSVGFRGVGEVWQDPNIVHHYRSSRFAGSGFASMGVTPWLNTELELGYMRQSANTGGSGVAAGYLELVPITLSVNVRKVLPNSEVFGGIGGSAVVFTESATDQTVSGTKPGLELRSGVRIHTDFVQPSMWSGASGGVKRVDIEILFGRRIHQPFGSLDSCIDPSTGARETELLKGCGFDFSAWRLGLGVVARL